MSGGIGYVDVDIAVEETLNRVESSIASFLGLNELSWRVAFNETGLIAVEEPPMELVELTISGRLSERVPEFALDESDMVRTPVFPVGVYGSIERVSQAETEGYEEVIARDVLEVAEIDEILPSPKNVLQAVEDRHRDNGIVDGLGNPWSERDSVLAAATAEQSLDVENPDVVISFDVFQTFVSVFQYQDFLKYDMHKDGEIIHESDVAFEKVVTVESLPPETLPEVEKVYVYQDRRVAASDYEITSKDIRDTLQGRVLNWNEPCTVADPSDHGLRTKIGTIAKIQLDDDQESYHGFVRPVDNLSISRLYDFYAAIRVPTTPYLTDEVAQESADWEGLHDHFGGWAAADNGFVLNGRDERRDINQRLYVNGYWLVRGQKYRRKREFESDVGTLQEFIEREFGCETSLREFDGTRISKTPILQSDILERVQEEVRAPPDERDLIEAVAGFANNSTEIDGIDQPLFPSDLSVFVADTSIIDAGVITRLISDGDLYDATIVVPDVVLEEIHRQVEREKDHGDAGLEELETLRELSDAGIVELEIVDTNRTTDTMDGVETDQTILQVAKNRDIPLCSADQTLLKFADVAGVIAYPLEQEMSISEQLITNALGQRGEVRLSYLLRVVYNQLEESKFSEKTLHDHLFNSPNNRPSEDIGMEMQIRNAIQQLERKDTVYRQGDVIGLTEEVGVVPTLEALEEETITAVIKSEDIFDEINLPEYKTELTVVLPSMFEYWASIQSNSVYLEELKELQNLEHRNKIDIEYESLLPEEGQAVLINQEQFSNLLMSLKHKAENSFPRILTIDSRIMN
ncbi:hypothetical protein [Halorussus salinus]|uniref:hypothetical protein n=1 Tax=Halorussus salinus TaxID=1364935 RepID=UPI001091B0BB|nr:hypothetical protein [Halorussus salinus]